MRKFIGIISAIFILTFFASAVSYWRTISNSSLNLDDICMTSRCIINFYEMFSGTFKIMQFGGALAWIFVFVSGVYIALKNYLISVKSTALSSHISHLSMFKEYLEGEVQKYDMLKLKKINIYDWYRLAFPYSSKGDISVSNEYSSVIGEIVSAIEETNKSINSAKGGYGYRKHQDRIKDVFNPLGIDITYLPKNDFHEIELQVLKLIDSVNHTFTDINRILSEHNREYV